jgi:hypothetical protein
MVGASGKMGFCIVLSSDLLAFEDSSKFKQHRTPFHQFEEIILISFDTMFSSFCLWQLLGRVKTACLMPGELESIFELRSPNPEGMVPRKRGKQATALGGSWFIPFLAYLYHAKDRNPMGAGYERA